jgi:acyl-CoA reductase-like NAD-dependent aldehyde dehydrogenase
MLARRFSSLAVRSLRETTTTSITLGNASAALGAAGARRDWSGRSISGIDVATSATIFKKTTTLGFLSPLSRRLFSSSDAVAEDAVSPRLTDKSLLQTGAFIGGEFVDAGRDETTSSPSSSSSSSTSNNNGSSSSSSSSPSSSSTGEPGKNNIGKTYEVVNPATAGVVARVARCGGVEATVAVEEAAAAFAGWKNRPARERAAVLSEWARLIAESSEDLATIVSLESGKPLAEARNELSSAVDAVTWSAAEAIRVKGSVLSSPGRGRRMLTLKQPVGVAGLITPWNFPASMVTRKAAPALAAGCTVVLKPAEATPLVALALAELARRAGVPPGVFNVVSGDAAAIGEAFLKSEAVRKIGFTGSTAVGR